MLSIRFVLLALSCDSRSFNFNYSRAPNNNSLSSATINCGENDPAYYVSCGLVEGTDPYSIFAAPRRPPFRPPFALPRRPPPFPDAEIICEYPAVGDGSMAAPPEVLKSPSSLKLEVMYPFGAVPAHMKPHPDAYPICSTFLNSAGVSCVSQCNVKMTRCGLTQQSWLYKAWGTPTVDLSPPPEPVYNGVADCVISDLYDECGGSCMSSSAATAGLEVPCYAPREYCAFIPPPLIEEPPTTIAPTTVLAQTTMTSVIEDTIQQTQTTETTQQTQTTETTQTTQTTLTGSATETAALSETTKFEETTAEGTTTSKSSSTDTTQIDLQPPSTGAIVGGAAAAGAGVIAVTTACCHCGGSGSLGEAQRGIKDFMTQMGGGIDDTTNMLDEKRESRETRKSNALLMKADLSTRISTAAGRSGFVRGVSEDALPRPPPQQSDETGPPSV